MHTAAHPTKDNQHRLSITKLRLLLDLVSRVHREEDDFMVSLSQQGRFARQDVADDSESPAVQPALGSRSARTTASGSASITRSSVDAGPEGRRRPCSYCCTVSSVKPKRRANCAWVSPNLARSARTCSGEGGGYTGSATASSASLHASPSSVA